MNFSTVRMSSAGGLSFTRADESPEGSGASLTQTDFEAAISSLTMYPEVRFHHCAISEPHRAGQVSPVW